MKCELWVKAGTGSGSHGFEEAARSPHGLQVVRMNGIDLDLLPQSPDVDVDASRRDEALLPPHGVEELVPGEDAVRTRGEVVEKPELEGGELNGFSVPLYAIGARVDGEWPDEERLLGFDLVLLPLRPPHKGLHSSHHLPDAEGLGDVIVRAELEPEDPVGLLAPCGEHDDGKRLVLLAFPNLFADFDPR